MSSECSINVALDRPLTAYYTNLDIIKGRVTIKITKEISVENIQVKLKGIAKTRISKQVNRFGNNKTTETHEEKHELLYDCDTLFPPSNIRKVSKTQDGYTLIPGVYEYEFEFQFPINSYCGDPVSIKQFSKFYNTDERFSSQPTRRTDEYNRIKKGDGFNAEESSGRLQSFLNALGIDDSVDHSISPLPPTSSGFVMNFSSMLSNRFDVEYLLKITVRRSSSVKLNVKKIIPLNFTTFEPNNSIITRYIQSISQNPASGQRSRLCTFLKEPEIIEQPEKSLDQPEVKKSFFKRMFSDRPHVEPKEVSFQVDIKFSDKIIRPHQTPNIAISLLTRSPNDYFQDSKGVSNGLGAVYVEEFNMVLIKSTAFRAKEFLSTAKEEISLNKVTGRNKRLDLSKAIKNKEGLYELEFPWESNMPAQSELPPSFKSCHITNTYSLKIRIKIGRKPGTWSSEKFDYTTDVWVLSGIPGPITLPHDSANQIQNDPNLPIYDESASHFPSDANEKAASTNSEAEPPSYRRD